KVTAEEVIVETKRLKDEGLSFQDADAETIRRSVEKIVRERKKNQILKNYKSDLRKKAVVSFL
ncbi:MAG: hypothetical protein JNM63_07245, partial [Spirochaetia bacterium]|nr:hypothetical protein [Spirochaetia bacterium]